MSLDVRLLFLMSFVVTVPFLMSLPVMTRAAVAPLVAAATTRTPAMAMVGMLRRTEPSALVNMTFLQVVGGIPC